MLGISRSSRITSGSNRSTSRTTSSPSEASPTTSKSGWVPRTAARPSRSTGWSSATRSRILSTRDPFERQGRLDAGPPAGAALHAQHAAEHGDPLPHAQYPVPVLRHPRRVEPAAVVFHEEPDRLRRGDEPDGYAPRTRVAGDVGEGFAADAVQGRLDAGRERAA